MLQYKYFPCQKDLISYTAVKNDPDCIHLISQVKGVQLPLTTSAWWRLCDAKQDQQFKTLTGVDFDEFDW